MLSDDKSRCVHCGRLVRPANLVHSSGIVLDAGVTDNDLRCPKHGEAWNS